MTTTSSNPHLLPVCPKKPQKGNKETDDEPSSQLTLNELKHESLILNLKRIFIRIMVFSKPDWRKILVFIGFMIIYAGGMIQSWAFTDLDMFGYPPPPFYDLIRPFPFWLVWVFTLAPLAPLTWLLGEADFIFGGPRWLFVIINIIYYYYLSCLVITFKDYKKQVDNGKREPGKFYCYFFGRKVHSSPRDPQYPRTHDTRRNSDSRARGDT